MSAVSGDESVWFKCLTCQVIADCTDWECNYKCTSFTFSVTWLVAGTNGARPAVPTFPPEHGPLSGLVNIPGHSFYCCSRHNKCAAETRDQSQETPSYRHTEGHPVSSVTWSGIVHCPDSALIGLVFQTQLQGVKNKWSELFIWKIGMIFLILIDLKWLHMVQLDNFRKNWDL